MVLYASFPYADHVLRNMSLIPNNAAQLQDIDTLIQAAQQLKSLIQGMENLREIRGFTVYKEDEPKVETST